MVSKNYTLILVLAFAAAVDMNFFHLRLVSGEEILSRADPVFARC
jgi:hypothetical protein